MRTLPAAVLVALSLVVLAGVGTAAASPSSDLSVTVVDSPDPVPIRSPLAYDVQVRNLGPDAATKVRVTVRIPKFADFVSARPSVGSCGPVRAQRFTCELGTMPAPTVDYGGPPSVAVTMTPARIGILTGSVSVDGAGKDPVTADDRATVTTRILAPPVSCRGRTATIVGSLGDDVLGGTPGPDVIAALNGDDTVIASSGRDIVCGGRGLDRLVGGRAADIIYGGAGDDTLLGGGGPDVLKGMPGRDLLIGRRGPDRLFGGRGPDRCRGGAGGDTLRSCESGRRRHRR
jgi:uncharacterized repeat protein (TIGR01451 family)